MHHPTSPLNQRQPHARALERGNRISARQHPTYSDIYLLTASKHGILQIRPATLSNLHSRATGRVWRRSTATRKSRPNTYWAGQTTYWADRKNKERKRACKHCWSHHHPTKLYFKMMHTRVHCEIELQICIRCHFIPVLTECYKT